MKEESVLTILMYLFRYHMHEKDVSLDAPQQDLLPRLEEVGFDRLTIVQAFNWLANFADELPAIELPQSNSIRVFSDYEKTLFDEQCQGLILSLVQNGVLTPHTRELVIRQVMALKSEKIDLNLIKWVALLVLFNQPGGEKALACLEFLVLNDDSFIGIH